MLQKYIQSMLFQNDVRTVNKKTFKLQEYKNYYEDMEGLVEDLYLSEHANWAWNDMYLNIHSFFYLYLNFFVL